MKNRIRFWDLTCTLFSGVGIGYLMGLSASPVLAGVLTSIVTIAVSVTSVMVGINNKESEESKPEVRNVKFNPAPATLLILGIVVGSMVGIRMRANDMLSPDPKGTIAKWQGAGLTEADIRKRLFDQFYPSTSQPVEKKNEDDKPKDDKPKTDPAGGKAVATGLNIHATVLYNITFSEVQGFLQHLDIPASLKQKMVESSDDGVMRYANKCYNKEDLRIAVEELIWPVVRAHPNQNVEGTRASKPLIVSREECARYKKEEGEVLREDMKRSASISVAIFALRCKDEKDLKLAVEELICGS